ncbi:MAG: PAS domain-containing protein [Rhodocyclales bacterium]|nr:PAS domain-containing protein [Rhodocyclales bacterium]
MDIVTVERSKQHWQFAADSLPQLICLLDAQGRIVRVNSTFQRWGLGDVFTVAGRDFHEALHPECRDADCYLRNLLVWGAPELVAGRQIRCDAFDPVLRRFFAIQAEPAQPEIERRNAPPALQELLAVVTFDDVTDLRFPNESLIRLNKDLGDQVVRERDKRRQVEAVWMRMQAIVERTASFVAMTDAAGKLIYLNPAGREMLGIGAAEDISVMAAVDLHAGSARQQFTTEAFPTAVATGTWMGRSVLRSRAGTDIDTLQVVIAHRDVDGRHEGTSVVMHDLTEWLKGEQALRQSHMELRRLSAQLMSVQEIEAQRIAADLHDGIGQSLSLMKLQVTTAVKKFEAGATADALRLLHNVLPKFNDAMSEVRRMSTDLHPASLEDLGILATLAWFFRELEETCCGIEVTRALNVRESDVPPPLRIAIFRILQEAVSNIVKHAEPKRIDVKLEKCDGDLQLSIVDDGRGFDPVSITTHGHPLRGFGLSSMRERAKLSGGVYRMESALGRGTCIRVVWPAAAMEN